MFKIVITDHFKKQLKPLVKKDRVLKSSLRDLLVEFRKEKAVAIGLGIYKVRLGRLGKGKSGGYRVYLFLIEIEGILTPLSIYSKSVKSNLLRKELDEHLQAVRQELEGLL